MQDNKSCLKEDDEKDNEIGPYPILADNSGQVLVKIEKYRDERINHECKKYAFSPYIIMQNRTFQGIRLRSGPVFIEPGRDCRQKIYPENYRQMENVRVNFRYPGRQGINCFARVFLLTLGAGFIW